MHLSTKAATPAALRGVGVRDRSASATGPVSMRPSWTALKALMAPMVLLLVITVSVEYASAVASSLSASSTSSASSGNGHQQQQLNAIQVLLPYASRPSSAPSSSSSSSSSASSDALGADVADNVDDETARHHHRHTPGSSSSLSSSSSSASVHFTLEALNGCYKWSSTMPHMVRVTPVFSPSADESDGSGSGDDSDDTSEASNSASAAGNAGTGQDSDADSTYAANLSAARNRCSSSAIVTPLFTGPGRIAAVIIAYDQATDHSLRCDVYIDNIQRIEILTTTRVLHRGDEEVFTVQGFDSEGNIFNSLEGIEFQWSILADPESTTGYTGTNVLETVKFKDSPLKVSAALRKMERKGLQGSSTLLRGRHTGTALVRAQIVQDGYESIAASDVKLSIIEPIQLIPYEPQLLAPCTYVKYRLARSKDAVGSRDIPLPAPQYAWRTSNETVAVVSNSAGLVFANSVGMAEVIVTDRNMTENEAKALLYVVNPAFIKFSIRPHDDELDAESNWALEVGREYILSVVVLDEHQREILISENMRLDVTFDRDFFAILHASANHSYFHIRAIRQGSTVALGYMGLISDPVTGSSYSLPSPLSVSQPIDIFAPIGVVPADVFLPYDGAIQHRYLLQAHGGSQSYAWKAAHPEIAAVSLNHYAIAVGLGSARIHARDQRNHRHHGFSTIHVLTPVAMSFPPAVVEAEVGSTISIPLAVFGNLVSANGTSARPVLFHNCSALSVTFSVSDPTVFRVTGSGSSLTSEGCSSVSTLALKEGSVVLTATFSVDGADILAETMLSAFNPLALLETSRNSPPLVTVGSSAPILYEGGPLPWPDDPSLYDQRMSVVEDTAQSPPLLASGLSIVEDSKSAYAYQSATSNRVRAYRVSCLEPGDYSLLIAVRNRPSPKHPFPFNATVAARFFCQHPHSILVRPVPSASSLSVKTGASVCPPAYDLTSERASSFILRNDRHMVFNLTVFDSEHRKFTNFSSLDLDWSLSDGTLASFDIDGELVAEKEVAERLLQRAGSAIEQKRIWLALTRGRSERFVIFSTEEGHAKLSVSVNGYYPEVLNAKGVHVSLVPSKPGAPLSQTIDLQLVGNVALNQDLVTVFNHPQNVISLPTFKGSGYFVAHVDEPSVASVSYNSRNASVSFRPLRVGMAVVTVVDLCLEGSVPASTSLAVSDVARIHLQVLDKIQLGRSVAAKVQVYDASGRVFDPRQHPLMRLSHRVSSDVIQVSGRGQDYTVTGVALGTSTLTFTTEQSRSTSATPSIVSSVPVSIQVFPRLELRPKEVILVPGAVWQVDKFGGPVGQVLTVFKSENTTVAGVNPETGLILAAHIGTTTVVAQVEGADHQTGERVVYSSDSVLVAVTLLTGVRIVTPATKLVEGVEFVVQVYGRLDFSTLPRGAAALAQDDSDASAATAAASSSSSATGTSSSPSSLSPSASRYAGPTSGETPFTFASPLVEFEWTSDDAVLEQLSVYHAANVTHIDKADFSIRLRAVAAGSGRLSVSVKQDLSSIHHPSGVRMFTDTVHFDVVRKLAVLSPTPLLLPLDSRFTIVTNKADEGKLRYSIISRGLAGSRDPVSVNEHGEITTSSVAGIVDILVISEDGSVVQSAIVHVLVKPVAGIALAPTSASRVGLQSEHPGAIFYGIRIGKVGVFTLELFSDNGEKFHTTAGVSAEHAQNRVDVVEISSHAVSPIVRSSTDAVFGHQIALHVRALSEGSALIHVHLTRQPHITSHIRVHAGEAYNGNIVKFVMSAGSSLCLSALATDTDSSGLVSSSDAVRIDKKTLHAQRVGNASISLTTSGAGAGAKGGSPSSTVASIVVAPVSKAVLKGDALTVLITNARSTHTNRESYRIPVQFFTREGKAFSGLRQCDSGTNKPGSYAANVKFKCTLSKPEGLFVTASEVDPETGTHYCVLRPNHPSSAALGQSKITLTATADEDRHVHDHVALDFAPGFVLGFDENEGNGIQVVEVTSQKFLEYGVRLAVGATGKIRVSGASPDRPVQVFNPNGAVVSLPTVHDIVDENVVLDFKCEKPTVEAPVRFDFKSVSTGQHSYVNVTCHESALDAVSPAAPSRAAKPAPPGKADIDGPAPSPSSSSSSSSWAFWTLLVVGLSALAYLSLSLVDKTPSVARPVREGAGSAATSPRPPRSGSSSRLSSPSDSNDRGESTATAPSERAFPGGSNRYNTPFPSPSRGVRPGASLVSSSPFPVSSQPLIPQSPASYPRQRV